MLTKIEYLLTCLNEECAEVQKESTKILRFGPSSHHPNSTVTNVDKLLKECIDILSIFELLKEERFLYITKEQSQEMKKYKKEKVIRLYKQYVDKHSDRN
jgi:hypothetical protein